MTNSADSRTRQCTVDRYTVTVVIKSATKKTRRVHRVDEGRDSSFPICHPQSAEIELE